MGVPQMTTLFLKLPACGFAPTIARLCRVAAGTRGLLDKILSSVPVEQLGGCPAA